MLDFDVLRHEIMSYHEQHLARCGQYVEDVLRDAAYLWMKRNRRHRVKFADVMGVSGFLVEIRGQWYDTDRLIEKDERYARVFADLTEAHDWYCHIQDHINICVEFTPGSLDALEEFLPVMVLPLDYINALYTGRTPRISKGN